MELARGKKVSMANPDEVVYTSVDDAVNSTASTLGVRNHNPLNIRYGKSLWVGQLGENKGFVVFDTMSHGVRAAFINARTQIKRGANTYAKLISVWAPSVENPTQSYIEFVCRELRVRPNDYISSESKEQILNLIIAMAKFESGYQVTTFDYQDWINRV